MSFVYLIALLISLAGMVVLDLRFVLFFWRNWRRATIVLAAGLAFFLWWDSLGVADNIFFPGSSSYVTGWMLAPGIPIEELFFLALLCYLTMNLFEFVSRLVAKFYRGVER